jgi:hypothetical protein
VVAFSRLAGAAKGCKPLIVGDQQPHGWVDRRHHYQDNLAWLIIS